MADRAPVPISEAFSLYVHIPFCETKCPYCDFNTYAKIESLMAPYVSALNAEVTTWGEALEHPPVKTVFLGGGTPSYLPSEHLFSILDTISRSFRVDTDAEITMESNPGDFGALELESYLKSGVNRLSIGVQSLDDGLLEVLGRRHTSAQAVEAYRLAKSAGFGNISLDLMYGLPHQSIDQWKRTLDGVLELAPVHLSMYCLTLEGGTPMEKWVSAGKTPDPDPDLAADMYLMAQDVMRANGYRHYEISNWAVPGFESGHNLTYWRNKPYLGVGPGAHSYLFGHRFYDLKSPRDYIRLLGKSQNGHGPFESALDLIKSVPVVEDVEFIDRRLEMAETLMMGLRLDDGIHLEEFENRFDLLPSQAYESVIGELTALGLLETSDSSLRLTQRGKMLGNEVFSRFFE